MEHRAVRADRHRIGRVSDWTPAHVDVFTVDAQTALACEVPVRAAAHLPRLAVVAENLRPAEVALKEFRDDHGGRLHLVTGVVDRREAAGAGAGKVAQMTPVVLALE